jgi:hypothetical protein
MNKTVLHQGCNAPAATKPLGVSIAQLPSYAPIHKTKAYELIKAGRLKTVVVGRRRIILWSSLEALLAPDEPETK